MRKKTKTDVFWDKRGKLYNKLLSNIKKHMPQLEKLLKDANDHWAYEDAVYRYYHGSFKVYYIQELTKKILIALMAISPHGKSRLNFMNGYFAEIYLEGTGKVFELSHNEEWSKHCRPILEAFFHTRYFLEMAIKYGKELETAPEMLPSGWASLLTFYKIR